LGFEKLQTSLEGGLKQLKSDLDQLQPKSKPSPSREPAKRQSKVEIPMEEAKSLDGIIAYLTKKHRGNVQEKGIVTMTSKSVSSSDDDPFYPMLAVSDGRDCALKNVPDLTSDSYFLSKDEPGQLVCWDFREMCVRSTHYTIRAFYLKLWVVEGSLDGSNWTEMDRKTNNLDFDDDLYWNKKWNTASFAVSKPVEFRFIRLTQTDKRHDGSDYLVLCAVEFFGTLSE
jgi:hypothetical protein